MAHRLNIPRKWIWISLAAFGGLASLSFMLRSPFKRRLVANAFREWDNWNHGDWKETDARVSKYLVEYYKTGVGQTISLSEARSSSFHASHQWSAVFISYLMKVSGAVEYFKYAANHSVYIRWAVQNRLNNEGKFRAYTITEYAPVPGDLVCFARQSGIDYYTTYSYASHCDLVVETAPGLVRVIGGNFANSVTLRSINTDSRGYIKDSREPYFAIIRTLL